MTTLFLLIFNMSSIFAQFAILDASATSVPDSLETSRPMPGIRITSSGYGGTFIGIQAAPVTLTNGLTDKYQSLRDPAMHSLGIGTTHDMRSVIWGIFLPSLKCREYSMSEKFKMWRGKSQAGISILWEEMLTTDLSQQVPELKIPVYFLEGIYDYTCSYTEARSYFERLKAPLKGFYTFENSAHSPVFEEPEKMLEILQTDVLAGLNTHADTISRN